MEWKFYVNQYLAGKLSVDKLNEMLEDNEKNHTRCVLSLIQHPDPEMQFLIRAAVDSYFNNKASEIKTAMQYIDEEIEYQRVNDRLKQTNPELFA